MVKFGEFLKCFKSLKDTKHYQVTECVSDAKRLKDRYNFHLTNGMETLHWRVTKGYEVISHFLCYNLVFFYFTFNEYIFISVSFKSIEFKLKYFKNNSVCEMQGAFQMNKICLEDGFQMGIIDLCTPIIVNTIFFIFHF